MLGSRLKEQREAKGLTQPQLAAIVGAAKRTVIDWEKGATSPTGNQLAALASAEFDVQYIVTGLPSSSVQFSGRFRRPGNASDGLRVAESEAHYGLPPNLRPELVALIDNYEHCTPEDQAAARRFVAAAAQPRSGVMMATRKRPRQAG